MGNHYTLSVFSLWSPAEGSKRVFGRAAKSRPDPAKSLYNWLYKNNHHQHISSCLARNKTLMVTDIMLMVTDKMLMVTDKMFMVIDATVQKNHSINHILCEKGFKQLNSILLGNHIVHYQLNNLSLGSSNKQFCQKYWTLLFPSHTLLGQPSTAVWIVGDCVQVIDVSEAQLVYSTSIFKSLATGGNVSQALVSLFSLLVPVSLSQW